MFGDIEFFVIVVELFFLFGFLRLNTLAFITLEMKFSIDLKYIKVGFIEVGIFVFDVFKYLSGFFCLLMSLIVCVVVIII